MATRIQVRRDLAANWTSNNPTLASGEIGLETDTRKWKIGNGSSNWTSLEYQLPSMTGSWASTPDENVLQIDRSTKRVGINAASLLHDLDVGGTFRATGNSTIGGTLSVTGNTTLSGDLAVNAATNADITTTTSTATVFNTNATTLNIGGAATTVGIGAATGTATINNATTAIAGNATVGGTLGVTGVISGPGTIPIGGIIMWNGSVVPTGWQLCDGTNSTPDLRNKFILGGNAYSSSAWRESLTGSTTSSGGSKDAIVVSHTHANTLAVDSGGAHTHTLTINNPGSTTSVSPPYSAIQGATGSTTLTTSSHTGHTHTLSGSITTAGSSGTNANLPPYFVLAFIQRMI